MNSRKPQRAETDRKPRSRKQRVVVHMHVVSEATGNLARHMTSVVLSQFSKTRCEVHHHAFCSTPQKLRGAKRAISAEGCGSESTLVFSALTTPRLKRSLQSWSEKNGIPHLDLLESVVDFVATNCGQRPLRDARKAHRFDEDYLNRIDAWEFTLQHDDSRRLETISQADIILVGVSRVGKTPLAAYLGSLGYRAANVAIAPECQIPSEIVECRERTIGLTIQPRRLSEIRKRRFEMNRFKQALAKRKLDQDAYYSLHTAMREVIFAESEFRRLKIPTLDMTDFTVEESAAHVLEKLRIT